MRVRSVLIAPFRSGFWKPAILAVTRFKARANIGAKSREIEYAQLVKIHRDHSPILNGFYHSLDVIDVKVQSLLTFIGMQLVAITFLNETLNTEAAQQSNIVYKHFMLTVVIVTVIVVLTAAVVLVSCLNIIGPNHRRLMRGLRQFAAQGGASDPDQITEVIGRMAEITGSRRNRYRFALWLTIASSCLIGLTITFRWNSEFIDQTLSYIF